MPVLFADRDDAGRKLAEAYDGPVNDIIVLGIPRGGVPVGFYLAESLGAALDVVVVRKLPIPGNPEAGFGAIAPDGTVVLNDESAYSLRLQGEAIRNIASDVLKEVNRREQQYRGDRPFPDLAGMNVVITDDGLATGYTMKAAINMVRAKEAATVIVAVPVSPSDTVPRIEPTVDYFKCLHVSNRYPFAVASFYHDFHDMTDDEVIAYLSGDRAAY